MTFTLPDLPYQVEALEPYMSAETLQLHHGKHHATYITKLNGLIEGTDLAGQSLEEIILATASGGDVQAVFNNAGQAWNHDIFWNCMTPGGGGAPDGILGDRIANAFDGYDNFRTHFVEVASNHFGSGWAWLVLDQGQLRVTSTANAEPPIVHGQHVLLGCDVWEHAYYLDYRNRRPDYAKAFLDHLVNWAYVAERLASIERASEAA